MTNSMVPFGDGGSPFDRIRQVRPNGSEFWSARDLQPLLGYEKWERFDEAIQRAMVACQNSGQAPADHFPGSGKERIVGQKGPRLDDYHLTRYACYLVAMNGDPRKAEIAAAQTYFAVQTHRQEQMDAQIPKTLPEALRAYAAALEEKTLLEAKVAEQKPLVAFAETCLTSSDSILIRELAKVATKHGLVTGEKRLYQTLREWGLVLKDSTESTQRAMDAGWFEVLQRPVPTPYGEILRRTTKVTPRGQVYIIERLKAEQKNG